MLLSPPETLAVITLGPGRVPSPLQERQECFVDDTRRVLAASHTAALHPFLEADWEPPAFELAGPRSEIFFALNRTTRDSYTQAATRGCC
jgi:hypothetical protein